MIQRKIQQQASLGDIAEAAMCSTEIAICYIDVPWPTTIRADL